MYIAHMDLTANRLECIWRASPRHIKIVSLIDSPSIYVLF